MKRRVSVLSVIALIMTLFLTATVLSSTLHAAGENPIPQPPAEEEPYVPPTSAPTTESTTASTTESTTASTTASTTESTSSSTSSTTESTSSTTVKPEDPEKSEPAGTTGHDPSSTSSTKANNSTPSTTKKTNGNKATTKRSNYVPANTTAGYTRMVEPVVENTEPEGTVMDPMQAYIERINNMTTELPTETTVTEAQEEAPARSLSTAAIVAICLIAVALVVVALTAAFAIRNKRAAEEDGDADLSDSGMPADPYDESDDIYAETPPASGATKVDDGPFTVVSLDDRNYKE